VLDYTTTFWIGVACFGFGIVAGLYLHYLIVYRPLLAQYHSLRKRGFVPQFEIEQARTFDLSEGISER
jgi:tellurite resistance protein TehA-like permease